MTLKDKVVLITGGSKGIGFGIAMALVREGARVAVTGRSADDVALAAANLNKLAKGSAIGIAADVREAGVAERVVGEVLAQWTSLDVFVANAGVGHFSSIETLTAAQWHETIDTNLTGVFLGVKAALPALKQSKGYIITMASLAGANFFAGASAYNASKFGLVGFSQAIMLDLRKYGIKVTTIMPGSVATYFDGNEPTSADDWKIQPEDLGQIVIDLLRMNPRTLPSKIEVRPSMPPTK